MSVSTMSESTATDPVRPRPQRRQVPMFVLNIAAPIIGIAIWAFLAGVVQVQNLPAPPAVLDRALRMVSDGTLFDDMVASLRRVFLGFGIGTLTAIPVGFLMGWYRTARGLIEPYVQFFRHIPPLAIIPLAMILLGIGETPKVFVIFLAAFLASVVATFQGVVDVDRTLINAARVLGASDLTIFAKVVVPASTPFILVGMRVGLGAGWGTLVASELIAAESGIGASMHHAQIYYDMDTIVVNLITIGVLGLVMDRLILFAERRLTGWQERR